jgi:hypothetical protein
MGLAGHYLAKSAVFFASAALCIPALIALSLIRGDEIDYARARNAGLGKQSKSFQRIFDLGRNPKLYIFAACVFLFQVADASMRPVVGQNLAQDQHEPMAGPDRRAATYSWTAVTVGRSSLRKIWAQASPSAGIRI